MRRCLRTAATRLHMESHGGMMLTGENRRTRRKTCPSASLCTTIHTLTGQGENPGLCGERPATNRRSHGTAYIRTYVNIILIWCPKSRSIFFISCKQKRHVYLAVLTLHSASDSSVNNYHNRDITVDTVKLKQR
jgi:hypothetical protein